MISIINLAVLFLSTALLVIFYNYSVQPAKIEKSLGPAAYKRCSRIRSISFVFYILAVAAYVVYAFFPLNLPFPRFFPWGFIPSLTIGITIIIISTVLLIFAAKAAGGESIAPKKENKMYGGIYQYIRHPQAICDTLFFIGIAFAANSPFLLLYSLIWIPLYYYICRVEEKDLLIRYGNSYNEYLKKTGMFLPLTKSKKK